MKSSRKKSSAINAARWISYAAAGAVTAMGAANDAEASILFSGMLNTPMPNGGGAQANLSIKTLLANSHVGVENIARFTHLSKSTGGTINPLLAKHSYSLHFRGSSANGDRAHGQPIGSTHGGAHYIAKLASGARISSGHFIPTKGVNLMGSWDELNQSTLMGDRKWSAAGTGFVGFEFNLTGVAGQEQYGWAKVINDGPKTYYMTLVDYAYGSVGQAITAGETGLAVPEPASLGLLALGAAGLLATRLGRRRKMPQAIA